MSIKRISVCAALVLLTLCALIMPFGNRSVSIADDEQETGQVMADGVNMRKSPDKDSDVIDELDCGEEVTVIGEDGNWYRVIHSGELGYIRKDYVFTNSAGSRGAYAVSDTAVLRGAPSSASYVVCTLTAGQGLKVKALIGEWYYAVVDTHAGYIYRSDITVSSSTLAGAGMLKQGMEGEEVKKLQQALYNRGFLAKDNVKLVADNYSMYAGWGEGRELPTQKTVSTLLGMGFYDAVTEGKIARERIIEMGDIINGKEKARDCKEQIMVYAVGGMSLEDVAWGYECYQNALKNNIGVKLNLWETPELMK